MCAVCCFCFSFLRRSLVRAKKWSTRTTQCKTTYLPYPSITTNAISLTKIDTVEDDQRPTHLDVVHACPFQGSLLLWHEGTAGGEKEGLTNLKA
jgi:predicted DCC family thiol-disulfide oxidoreductase YuxK